MQKQAIGTATEVKMGRGWLRETSTASALAVNLERLSRVLLIVGPPSTTTTSVGIAPSILLQIEMDRSHTEFKNVGWKSEGCGLIHDVERRKRGQTPTTSKDPSTTSNTTSRNIWNASFSPKIRRGRSR